MVATDALVIGAGIAGAATAYFLTKAGLSVCLVEARCPAWGASGRNPGFLWVLTKPNGLAMEFSLAGRVFAEELAGDLPDHGFRSCGGLIAYRDDSLSEIAENFAQDRRSAGLPTRHIDRTEALSLCPRFGPAISGAVWNPLDAHQDTRRLVSHLVEAAKTAGCDVRRGETARRLLSSNSRCTGAELGSGEDLAAGVTVVSAGPWANDLLAPLGLVVPMVPMRFEAAETAPAPFEILPVICGQALFKFFNTAGKDPATLPSHPGETIRKDLNFTEQIAQYPDGSLQFGCAFETGSTDDRPTTAGQGMAAAVMADNIVGFAELPLLRSWAGIVGQTADGLPVIDTQPGPEGLAINAGHFFGNLVGAMSGRMIADAVTSHTPVFPIDSFRLARFAAKS
jgi:glycine/D-amino acid oxidase-like deaminating enzyme